MPESWFERYGPRSDDFRLPKGAEQLKSFATQVGEDGWLLLHKLAEHDTPLGLAALPATAFLRRKWQQQYWLDHGTLRWRDVKNLGRKLRPFSSHKGLGRHEIEFRLELIESSVCHVWII